MNKPVSSHQNSIHQDFLFSNFDWEGLGSIIILQTGATLHYKILQSFSGSVEDRIKLTQKIELSEGGESWEVLFEFHHFDNNRFLVDLYSEPVGQLSGEGFFHDRDLTWKIYDNDGKIIGTTLFTRNKDDTYLINSAYKLRGNTQISISGFTKKCYT